MARPRSTRICDVEDCDLPHSAKGFCRAHYMRNKLGMSLVTPINHDTLKRCLHCKAVKSIEDYAYNRRKKGLRQTVCRECDNAERATEREARGRTKNRAAILMRDYKLSWDRYVRMFDVQGGRCAICAITIELIVEADKQNASAHVDHDNGDSRIVMWTL
jgi:hypothetical protein